MSGSSRGMTMRDMKSRQLKGKTDPLASLPPPARRGRPSKHATEDLPLGTEDADGGMDDAVYADQGDGEHVSVRRVERHEDPDPDEPPDEPPPGWGEG